MTALPKSDTTRRPLVLVHADQIALDDLLTEMGGDISDPAVAAAIDEWIDEIQRNIEKGTDRYVGLIREMELRAEARTNEAKRLKELASIDENAASRLRDRLKQFYDANSISKVKTERFNVTVQKNGGKAPLELIDMAQVPEQFIEWQPALDKEKVRTAIEKGEDVPGVRMLERGTSLRIK